MKITPSKHAGGFALPTILIASVVMMIILVGTATTISSLRSSIVEHYYGQLADEAAESGYARVLSCLRDSDSVVTWSDTNPLAPNTDCNGAQLFSCPDGTADTRCYVMKNGRLTSTFSIGGETIVDGAMTFSGGGTLRLSRSVNAALTEKLFRSKLRANVNTGVRDASYVSSGYLGVCAIFDGKSWCWGDNRYGQMGNGELNNNRVTIPERVIRLEGGLLGKRDKLITLGTESACLATTDDEIYCWGRNDFGQAGNGQMNVGNKVAYGTSGNATNVYTEPQKVVMPAEMQGKEIKDIVMGFRHACALADTDVYCWGNGGYGQLGNHAVDDHASPVRVMIIGASNDSSLPVTSLASSNWSDTNCAIAGGKSYCWGRNNRGQLGDPAVNWNMTRPKETSTTSPSSIEGKILVKIVMSGGFAQESPYRRGHVCALDTTKRVHCWGSDQHGQVGRGYVPADTGEMSQIAAYPYLVNIGAVAGKSIADVAVSFGTTCVLTTDNQLYCWGVNDRGQVGDNTQGAGNTPRVMPRAVYMGTPGLQGKVIDEIVGGANRNCALAESMQYCWGVNTAGQLGDGTLINRPRPTEATVLRQHVPVLYY